MEKNVPSLPRNRHHRLPFDHRLAFVALLFFSAAVQAQPSFINYLAAGSKNFTATGGQLYYSSEDSLFTADGTSSGTLFIKKIEEPILSISNISIGSKIFFLTQTGTQQSLWTSDGTAANTFKIGTHNSIHPMIAHQSELYLLINDGIHGRELWKLSSGNTLSMLKDIAPGSWNGFAESSGVMAISNNVLYFIATSDGVNYDLWKTDGSGGGTVVAVDMPFEGAFGNLTDVDGTMFFSHIWYDSWDGTQHPYLWKTQGTESTTQLVKALEPDYPYSNLSHFTALNEKLYFIWNWGVPDHFLWVSDGTEAGTQEIKHVERDGGILEMSTAKDQLVFYSQSQSFPGPIQKSDGTVEGTVKLHQLAWYLYLNPADNFVNFTPAEDFLFFVDDISDGYPPMNQDNVLQLWQSDLTPENTKPLKELYNMSFTGADNVVALGNKIFFTTLSSNAGFRLWYYDPAASQQCAGAGGILREVWNNISGPGVSQIPVNTPPSLQEVVNAFEGPSNVGDKYGSRYRGYLCVPQTGQYRFWIASNDHSELWLSTNATPDDKVLIASVTGYTNVHQYNKYASQQSVLVTLQAGTLYYIEALHKEGVGTDHISVQLQYPDGTIENPIQGARLIPYSDNIAPLVAITSPADGEAFPASTTLNIQVNASDVDGSILKVEFYAEASGSNNQKIGEDNSAPYSLTWGPLAQGTYKLQARAIDNEGLATISSTINITVTACQASGTILREVWTGYQGSRVSDIPWETPPTTTSYLNVFEAPANIGDHYGTRIRGYICPPVTGTYEFFIASNDHSELWLSESGHPAHTTKIASVVGGTGVREWNKYSSQRSGLIFLRQGMPVYIEALHKEGVGSDHIAVGWTLPGGTQEMPIPGTRLSPFEPAGTALAGRQRGEEELNAVASEELEGISLSPNPARPGPVTLTFKGINNDHSNNANVQIISMVGEVLYSEPITCHGDCNEIILEITEKFAPGVYIIKGAVNDKRFSERLIVH